MCGCKICIHAGAYQELLNHLLKRRLRSINNNKNPLTRGSVEKFNAEIMCPYIVMFYWLMENRYINMLNMPHFPVCVNFLTKYIFNQSGHV